MKIICIGKGNDPRCLGGVETFERVLEKTFNKNIKFLVWNSEKEKIFECTNVENIQSPKDIIGKILLKILGKTRYTAYKVRKEKPDVVIINKPKDMRMIKKLNCKKILVQHGALTSYTETVFKQNWVKDLIRNKLDKYVLLSEKSRELFSKELNIDYEKAVTIRHSCEIPLFKGQKVKNKKLIIIARLENTQKRIDLAIMAMKKLPEYTLEIWGDGPSKSFLESLVEKEKLQNKVFF